MSDESSGVKRRDQDMGRAYRHGMSLAQGKGNGGKGDPGHLVSTWLPVFVILVTFVGAVSVAFNKLSDIEERLVKQASTMDRLEGALSHMELLDFRITTLEDQSREQRGGLAKLAEVVANNKLNVRNAKHDLDTFRGFLPIITKERKGDG